MKMKLSKLIIMTALSSLTMQSFAQNPLESLRNIFASGTVTMQCDYETEFKGTLVVGHSDVVVQDSMYSMQGNGLEVYCNGKTIWTVDESSCEVVIEPYSALDRDYMVNPVLMLLDFDKLFRQSSCRNLGNGKVELVLDAVTECGVAKAFMVLNSDGTVDAGTFVLEDGNEFSVQVTAMKKTEEKPVSFFSPQRKFGSDWVVTDLR
jgi:hypothetical protein